MKKIGLISDTHGYFGEDLKRYLQDCDEIWHAGDIGIPETAEKYENFFRVFRAVTGNIDGHKLRRIYEPVLDFEIEGIRVLMIHIGGYPGRYSKEAFSLLQKRKYDLFISGHSHITKVMRDKKFNLIHMNPGSCGHHGFHLIRTILRFEIHEGRINNAEVVELGKRGRI